MNNFAKLMNAEQHISKILVESNRQEQERSQNLYNLEELDEPCPEMEALKIHGC
jgi:hypothetical protein